MSYDHNNIFAKMLRGEIKCDKVYEDDYALAFNDIQPKAPIHVLVIPKGPYLSIAHFTQDASPEEVAGFFRALGQVVNVLGVGDSGFRTIANTGLHGGQEVPHFHIHLLAGRTLGPIVAKETA